MTRTLSLIRAFRKKLAGMPTSVPTSITTPQTQQMSQAPAVAQPTGVQNTTQSVLTPPAQRPHRHVMGTGVPQTGLPPAKVNAAPLPGAPGGVASNPIEVHGALGPAGTVDGNHARGVAKGFKIG